MSLTTQAHRKYNERMGNDTFILALCVAAVALGGWGVLWLSWQLMFTVFRLIDRLLSSRGL